MKFRGVIREPHCMREFNNVIMTLTKLSKECVINLCPDMLIFAVNEQGAGNSAPLVWIEMDPKQYFTDYRMENNAGIDDDGVPHILLSVSMTHLGRAFAAIRQSSGFCKLKLTRLQFPCLSVEVIVTQNNSDGGQQTRMVTHDIPITLIARSDWAAYMLPMVPNAKVVLTVPSDRMMRHLIDKLKNLSPSIVFHASTKGEMNIIIETELATITTHISNLGIANRNISEGRADQCSPVESQCSVDCKKLAHFFSALQVATLELSCSVDEHCIHLEVNARPGIVIHSILPAVCM